MHVRVSVRRRTTKGTDRHSRFALSKSVIPGGFGFCNPHTQHTHTRQSTQSERTSSGQRKCESQERTFHIIMRFCGKLSNIHLMLMMMMMMRLCECDDECVCLWSNNGDGKWWTNENEHGYHLTCIWRIMWRADTTRWASETRALNGVRSSLEFICRTKINIKCKFSVSILNGFSVTLLLVSKFWLDLLLMRQTGCFHAVVHVHAWALFGLQDVDCWWAHNARLG